MAKTKRELVLENIPQIEAWCAEGKTVRWIAQELGVGKTLIYEIAKEDREIQEAIENREKPKKEPKPRKRTKTETDKLEDRKPSGLADAIKNGRSVAVEKIESTMFNSAVGFTRKEKRYAKLKRVLYDEMTGKKTSEYEEMVEYEEERYYPPDATSGIFLLKNWARYANEPVTNDLRKREIELKEKQAEANSW